MMRRGLGDVTSQIQAAAPSYGVPPSLALAVAQQESSLNPNAVSPKGAQGLFQLMPATAASLGVTNPFDPSQSIAGGLTYLKSLYDQFGNWSDALIAYNEGPGTLSSGTVYSSSQSYADSILSAAGLDLGGSPSLDLSSGSPISDSFTSADTLTGDYPFGLSAVAFAGLAAVLAVVVVWIARR